jgi:hypothetical protein
VESAPFTVAVVTSRTEAELAVGLLRSHGLRATHIADDVGGQEPQLQQDGVRVLVAPDEAAARRILADIGDRGTMRTVEESHDQPMSMQAAAGRCVQSFCTSSRPPAPTGTPDSR